MYNHDLYVHTVVGNLTFLDVVCSKTVFPPNGRLVDKNSQTPLHIVMRTKPTERTVQVNINN